MSLPSLISIEPLPGPISAQVVIPGSKSLTNRALVLAALSSGKVTLQGALWSEDTQIMTEALHTLGFEVKVISDVIEPANRTISVVGLGGKIPKAGTAEAPLDIYVGNAGTAARFLAAMLCLGQGCYRLHGVPRMHERPQASLFQALRQLGYQIETPNDYLPAVIHGTGPKTGAKALVSVDKSSQFASALILSQKIGGWEVETTGANPDELPYVDMTRRLAADFPYQGGEFQIEPDASSASYFWGADWLLRRDHSRIEVLAPPNSGLQADERFFRLINEQSWKPEYSRSTELADSIMTAIVLAPFAPVPTAFTELGRLRVQECERVLALKTELTKCGAVIEEKGDTLLIQPSLLQGAQIHAYKDHRMAMCFGLLALKVPGMSIEDPACVAKTFPNFFAKLAAPAPYGLGAVIREAATGEILMPEQLSV